MMVQVVVTVAGVGPQVLVCAKLLDPEIPMEVTVSGPEPVFDRVTGMMVVVPSVSLPNASGLGNRVADGAAPDPERETA